MPVRILASLCVCLVLVACGHTPIMSIYKLSQLDAATVDIGGARNAELFADPDDRAVGRMNPLGFRLSRDLWKRRTQ